MPRLQSLIARRSPRRWLAALPTLVLVAAVLVAGLTTSPAAPARAAASLNPPVAKAQASSCPLPGSAPYLHTCSSSIVDAAGNVVRLKSLNWYGAEGNDFVLAGLHYYSYRTLVDQIKQLGFNSLRIPFSDELVERNPVVSALTQVCVGSSCVPVPGSNPPQPITGAYLLAAVNDTQHSNADLVGLNALDLLKRIVDYAGSQGLSVILDQHRSEAGWSTEANGLWYTDYSCAASAAPYTCYSPQSWLDDWAAVETVFQADPAVIGLDLHNEPHSQVAPANCAQYEQSAHWGPCDGIENPVTDWAAAAQQAGNEALARNPHWLLMVEGVSTYPQADGSFPRDGYAENLQGVVSDPLRLDVANQLVYSPHDYRFFQTNDTAAHLQALWDRNFGFATAPGQPYTAPVWVGEYGTCTHANNCVQDVATGNNSGFWFSAFLNYLNKGDANAQIPGSMSWSYWALNGTYGDGWAPTGGSWKTCYGQREDFGILGSDWSTPSNKFLLSKLIGPAISGTPPAPSGPWPSYTCQPYTLAPPTSTPTNTPLPTNTPTNTPTSTPTDTPTNTPTDTPTNTPTSTPTNTPTNTPTSTPLPTSTPTNTPLPTSTPTNTPLPTSTPTWTTSPVRPTMTPVIRVSPTPTKTPSRPVTPPALVIGATHLVISGSNLTVTIRTAAAHTSDTATLRITTSVTRYVGSGKARHKVTTRKVLYSFTRRGATGAQGRAIVSLPVRYTVHVVMQGSVVVQAVERGKKPPTVSKTLGVLVAPALPHVGPTVESGVLLSILVSKSAF